jgi:hypothetical protein
VKDSRILNITRGFRLKRNQALKAIEQCACAWVVPNESIRDLTLAESVIARNKQASERDPLDYAELPGITFKPPIGAQAAHINEIRTAFDANLFYTKAIQ